MKPQAVNSDPPKPKLDGSKPTRKNDSVEARPSTTQKVVANPATRKKAAQKARNFHFSYLFFVCYLSKVFIRKYAFCQTHDRGWSF